MLCTWCLMLWISAKCKAEPANYKVQSSKYKAQQGVLSARSYILKPGEPKMSKSLLLMLCILTGLLVLACARADTNRNAAPATATTPAPAGTPATNANTASSGNQVGIAECDNFITAYENCVSSKVPEAARAQLRQSVATWRTEWKRLADNPQTRGTLAVACRTQREATQAQMKAYGCTF